MYIPCWTCFHILLAHPCLYYYLLSLPVHCPAHLILLHILIFLIFFYFNLYLCIFSCVVLHILHCPLSGPDLTYISLLIIFCIIEYVTNKTLNLTWAFILTSASELTELLLHSRGFCWWVWAIQAWVWWNRLWIHQVWVRRVQTGRWNIRILLENNRSVKVNKRDCVMQCLGV